MILTVSYLGASGEGCVDEQNDLLLLILQRVSGRKVKVVASPASADLLLAYPYCTGSISFRIKWFACMLIRRLQRGKYRSGLFRWLLGSRGKPVLFVSHENLDRPYWWNMLGRFLIESNVPRLTFWPTEIDPNGARFPYWYNYVDWSEYPRKNFYHRFGCLYDVKQLMSPLQPDSGRQEVAVSISSHLDHPRQALLSHLKSYLAVDSWGGAGRPFEGGKLGLMRRYKYAFCPENSVGYGYDTEKLPEAWSAGCIPVGVYLNPFSDFNPAVFSAANDGGGIAYRLPLVLNPPSLKAIEDYVRKFFEENFINNSNSSESQSIPRRT